MIPILNLAISRRYINLVTYENDDTFYGKDNEYLKGKGLGLENDDDDDDDDDDNEDYFIVNNLDDIYGTSSLVSDPRNRVKTTDLDPSIDAFDPNEVILDEKEMDMDISLEMLNLGNNPFVEILSQFEDGVNKESHGRSYGNDNDNELIYSDDFEWNSFNGYYTSTSISIREAKTTKNLGKESEGEAETEAVVAPIVKVDVDIAAALFPTKEDLDDMDRWMYLELEQEHEHEHEHEKENEKE